MNAYLGEIAALLTAVMFSTSAAFFAVAGRQVGSLPLNRVRLLLAVGWLLLAHLLLQTPLPLNPALDRLFWLSLSGIIGLVIGDIFLFQAYILIGPRMAMLLMALSPAIAAVTAWVLMGETLHPRQIIGIALTLAGIAWVVSQRAPNIDPSPGAARHDRLGLLSGLGAAAGQAIGLVTARLGLYGDFPALSGTLIRMLAATLVLWGITLVTRQAGPTIQAFRRQPKALGTALGGAFFGPFLGVTLSLYAVQHTQVGVASTLNSLSPIMLLPISYFIFKERFGWQVVAGTLLAMLGVGLLFWE
jgi:drug/metabolite transporter (DMT)-like permease